MGNKERLYWILGIIILLIIIFYSGENYQEKSIAEKVVEESEKQEILKKSQEIIKEKDEFLVTYVVDGDTLEIETGERVRFVCIDTPERGESGYSEAKEYLKGLVLNKEIKLVKDISETGKYGRLVRYVYLTDGTFVNELIVKNGYGKAYWYEPDTTLCPQIQEAEDYAKENELGIWKQEEIQQEVEEEIIFSDLEYDCSSNIYNCGDFNTYAEAKAVFDFCGGTSNDIHRLDGDDDGEPCESLI